MWSLCLMSLDESWLTFSVETLLSEACGAGEPVYVNAKSLN